MRQATKRQTSRDPLSFEDAFIAERSQHRNRKLAMARLVQKIEALNSDRVKQAQEERWRAHHGVERGNPVRVFRTAASSQ